jgi:hypothetical protein
MNSKKKILMIGGISLILIGAGAVVLKVAQKPKPAITPDSIISSTPAPEEKLLTYNDEAGFSFEYPESLKIEDISGNLDVYSILEITSETTSGTATLKVVDTKYKTIDDWLKKTPEASTAGSAREIELAGMTGQQIQLENPRRLVTSVIDGGVLYYLESPLDSNSAYWNKAHNAIVSSFNLGETKPQAGSQTGGDSGQDIIYEEEEIVE